MWPFHRLFYSKAEKLLRAKITELRTQGNLLVSVERKKLEKNDQVIVIKRAFFTTVVSCTLTGLVSLVFWINFFSSGEILSLIPGIIFLILFALSIWFYGRDKRNCRNWDKVVIQGVISDKYWTLAGRRDPRIFVVKFLRIGDREILVKSKIYSSYRIGDGAEFHLLDKFGWFKIVLNHKKLFEANLEQFEPSKNVNAS